MWRKISLALLTLVALAGLAAGAAFYLSKNEAFLKERARAAVWRTTGRELAVDGHLRLDLGRVTTLEAEGVSLSNAPWAGPEDMARAGRLRLALDLPALLVGRLEFRDLEIAECRLGLAENEAGEANWKLVPEPPDDGEDEAGWILRLHRLKLTDCHLAHVAPERKQPLVLDLAEAWFELGPDQQYTGSAAGAIDGQPVRFLARMDLLPALLDGGHFEHDLSLQVGDITFSSSGSVAAQQYGSDTNVSMRFAGPEFETVTGLLALPPVSSGAFDFRLDLSGAGGATKLAVAGDLGSLEVTATGLLERLRPTIGELDVEVSGPDVAVLNAALGEAFANTAFKAQARILGSADTLAFNDLDLRIGKSKVTGELRVRRDHPTRVSARLESEFLDLSHWLAERADEPGAAAHSGRQGGRVFDDDRPVARFAPDDIDLDLQLRVARIGLGNTELADLRLGLALEGGVLRLQPFALRGPHGSSVNGQLVLDGQQSPPRLTASLQGRDIRIGLAAAKDQSPETYPPMELELRLTGTGETPHALASGLDGRLRVYHGEGRIAAAGLELVFSDFISELFRRLNPFAARKPYTELDCAVFAADVTGGRVEVAPIVVRTRELTIFSEGVIDLGSERIDLQFNTRPRTGIGLSAGVLVNRLIRVGGTLSDPAMELDKARAVISGGAAVVTSGLSLLAKSFSDRFLGSDDPCGDARRALAERDARSD